jgi:hypothetical protein
VPDSSRPKDERPSPIAEFIQSERDRFKGDANNLFAFSLGQAARYYEFLAILATRFEAVSAEYVACQSQLRASFPEGETELVGELLDRWHQSLDLGTQLHLDIESFYLFGKILLDKLAQFTGHYFGQVQSCSLASHNKLVKNIERFAHTKGAAIHPELLSAATALKEQIADFRDKQIAHNRNPRTVVGTIWSSRGDVRLAATHLYPRPSDPPQVESSSLQELFTLIDTYVAQLVFFVTSNRTLSRFALSESTEASPSA